MKDDIESDALVRAAWDARDTAYGFCSGSLIRAGLITQFGAICRACNVESFSLSLTTCAGRAEFFAAIKSGARGFVAIAIVTAAAHPVFAGRACSRGMAAFAPALLGLSDSDRLERLQWSVTVSCAFHIICPFADNSYNLTSA